MKRTIHQLRQRVSCNRWLQKTIAAVLSLLICLSCFPVIAYAADESATKWTEHAASAFAGGSGTEVDPYQISNGAQLALWAKEHSKYIRNHFKLTENIDLSAHEWVPIESFYGVLDGNNFRIDGVKIGTSDVPESNGKAFIGFFAELLGGAVKNLTVNAEIYVSDTSAVTASGTAILAGHLKDATLDHCFTEGSIRVTRENAYVGGLVGYVDVGTVADSRIINCGNKATITVSGSTTTEKQTRAGGIAGFLLGNSNKANNILIANCYNIGTVILSNGNLPYAGGICGWLQSYSKLGGQITVVNCYNAGTVRADGYTGEKGRIANIVPKIAVGPKAEQIQSNFLYGAAANCITGTNAVVSEALTQETADMQSPAFVTTLNDNVTALTTSGTSGLARWIAVADGTPTFAGSSTPETPETAMLTVTVIGSSHGTVTVAKASGGEYTDLTGDSPYTIEKGSSVRVTITPDDGYEVSCVPEGAVAGENGTYVYTIINFSENTELSIEFRKINKYWTDYAAAAFAGGSGTAEDPYQIANGEQLALWAKDYTKYISSHFKLTADVNLSAHDWVPITAFSGILDGNGKRISGLKIGTEAVPASEYQSKAVGLFTTLSAAAVKDLTVSAAIYVTDDSTWEGAAIISGYVTGAATFDHCFTEGVLSVNRKYVHAGGLAGYVEAGAKITNCGNYANIFGGGSDTINYTRVGGLVGSAVISSRKNGFITIANCYNVGAVTATGGNRSAVGGISGVVQNAAKDQTSEIRMLNCYSTGTIGATSYTITKAYVGHIVPSVTGKVQMNSLYGVSYALTTGEQIGTVVKCANQYDMMLDDMKTATFAKKLTVNADTLVENGMFCQNELSGWKAAENGTPIFDDTFVEGVYTALNISVNSSRLGSIVVAADESGGANFTPVGSTDAATTAISEALKKNSQVKITMTPAAGCAVSSFVLNGEATSVTGNEYIFTLTEAATVEITFTVSQTYDTGAIYVDPNAAAGGSGTEAAPFQTLEEVKGALTNILAEHPNADVTVYLMDGTYTLDHTLTFSANDSSLGRITFQNYEGAKPVITSGHKLNTNEIQKVDGKPYYSYQLPDSAKENGSFPMFRDLYVNGELATIARTEDLKFKYSYDNQVGPDSKITSMDNSLYVSQEALAGVTDNELSGVELGQLVEWKSQIFHIASRNTANAKDGEVNISLRQSEWNLFVQYDKTKKNLTNRVYWLQNHLSFLDEPGEFYYDRVNGVIYYYPNADQDMTTADIEYATLDKLIELDHAANFTFDGIRFTGTTANLITADGLASQLGGTLYGMAGYGDCGDNIPCAAIFGNYTEGICVQNCVFESLGGSAMVFQYGTKDLSIIGNRMKDLAIAGLQVGVPQCTWADGASERVVVKNNYVTNVGRLVYGAPGIAVRRCDQLQIMYNKIVHVPYSGIMAGWGFDISANPIDNKNLINAEIAYNYIEDFLYKINDGGAIYVNGANAAVTDSTLINSVHDNYIRGGAHNLFYAGIYHDGSSSNWHNYHNLIDDVKSKLGPIFFQDDVLKQASHYITAENNFTTTSKITQAGELDKNGDQRNITLRDNTMFTDRGALSNEAKAIMNGAGLQSAYQQLESPMDVELRIEDDTMHYIVSRKQESDTTMRIALTNNSAESRVFTLTTTDELPNGIRLVINDNQPIPIPAGNTVYVNARFVITDAEQVNDTEDCVIGFKVTDTDNRTVLYPRTFTICTLSGNISGEIPYGTPTVDGALDEVYKNGVFYPFGEVFHPSTDAVTDLTGGYYLVWDENYLYCYAVVNESTIMSRGTEWIHAQIDAGKQGNLWETDAIETYLNIPSIKRLDSKFAVDAFGVARFGNANIGLEHHTYLPYAVKFTDANGIIDQAIPAAIPAGAMASEVMGRPVTGYVVEMTLPIKLIGSIIDSADGVPSAGDVIEFYVQNNDYQGQKADGSIITVAKHTEKAKYVLQAKNTSFVAVRDTDYVVNSNDWQSADFVVTGVAGCKLSRTNGDDAVWSDTLSASDETATGRLTFYVQKPDGTVSELVEETYKIDKTAPAISGVSDGNTYYAAQEITVTDANLTEVTVNGTPIQLTNGKFTLTAANGAQVIVAADVAGNTSTVTVWVFEIHSWGNGNVNTESGNNAHSAFLDVKTGDYFYDAVQWAVKNGIANGMSETQFSPNASCTRAQMVTFLWRAAGSPEPENTTCNFTDVKSSEYYYKAVLWAVEKGITDGRSATTFSPDEICTRGQTVAFLYRYAGNSAVSAKNIFTDVKSGEYYYTAVLWAIENGITGGTSKTTFSPKATCTRAQIVTFLYRSLVK